jgi:hypothetical protein
MGEIEQIQEAIDRSRQESEPDLPQEIEGQLMRAFDYLDLIMIKSKKLSGIIACLGGLQDDGQDDDFSNLAWAMKDYTDAIMELAKGLWDHLKDIKAL